MKKQIPASAKTISTESCCLCNKETNASWLKTHMVLHVCLRSVTTWLLVIPLAAVFLAASQACGSVPSPDVALP